MKTHHESREIDHIGKTSLLGVSMLRRKTLQIHWNPMLIRSTSGPGVVQTGGTRPNDHITLRHRNVQTWFFQVTEPHPISSSQTDLSKGHDWGLHKGYFEEAGICLKPINVTIACRPLREGSLNFLEQHTRKGSSFQRAF